MYPFALVALGAASYYARAAWRQPRPAVIVAVILWLLYAVYEVLIAKAVLCDEKCNIRVDVILIWPLLWVASFFASKTPGVWSRRSKLLGALSIGSLCLAVLLIVGVVLEDMDVFFPARRACKTGGDGAVRACDEALAKAPGDFTLYYHRALAYRAQGEHDRAIADMSKAIEAAASPHSTYSDGYTGRGTIYYEKGDLERALSDFNAAIKVDPNDAVAHVKRGAVYAGRGELDRALADFTKFIDMEKNRAVSPDHRLSPGKGAAFDSRGLVHLRLGNLDKAISDYDAALKLDPRLAVALYGRGIAKIRMGDKAGGDADIASAKAIKTGIAEEVARFGVTLP